MQSVYIDGEKVREWRKRNKFSLAELSAKIGVSRGFVHLLEKGKSGISLEKLELLASALGIEKDVLSPKVAKIREPRWLRFLEVRHSLSDSDKKLLKRIVRQSGIPSVADELLPVNIESVWEQFYQHIQAFLSNPMQKFFADDDVRSALLRLGLAEPFDWRAVRQMVCDNLCCWRDTYHDDACGQSWKNYVAKILKVHVIDLSLHSTDECIAECSGDWSIIGGIAMVASSPSVYGAIYRHLDGRYTYIGDSRGRKSERGDYPFWHEIARVLLDPELKLGKGSVFFPDGEERPPFEKLLCRVASWIAFGFLDLNVKMLRGVTDSGGRLSMDGVNNFKARYYPSATTRMAAWSLMDACDKPMMYVDLYLRLKQQECLDAGIKVSDVEDMSNNPKARLRVGFVAKNIACENLPVTLRFNLRVAEQSCMSKSFYGAEVVNCVDDFSQWDRRYNLCGKVEVRSVVVMHGVRHVKAILNVLENV